MELLRRAQSGDQQAFAQLTDGYRQEIQLHCYRILGSTQDAEDALQETFLGAWQALANYEERASIRTWLYRIATNRCLNMLRAASRRPAVASSLSSARPEPTRVGEVVWLEPYPDILLDGLPDDSPGPDARYESRESVSLAFITILQLLPPRQRVALVLRDVLGYRASEAAEMIDATEASVESALKRARVALHDRLVDALRIASLPLRPTPLLNKRSSPASPLHSKPETRMSSSPSSPKTSRSPCRQYLGSARVPRTRAATSARRRSAPGARRGLCRPERMANPYSRPTFVIPKRVCTTRPVSLC
jgi:RNA polymerase sigma factor (sigma-70 family)